VSQLTARTVQLSVWTGIVLALSAIRSIGGEIPFHEAIVQVVACLAAALLGGDYLYSKWRVLTEQRPGGQRRGNDGATTKVTPKEITKDDDQRDDDDRI